MARPKKKQSDIKGSEVRIPVTADQKKTIAKAAARCEMDVATWGRRVLLSNAAMIIQ